jgi:hypothetical protein
MGRFTPPHCANYVSNIQVLYQVLKRRDQSLFILLQKS